MRWAAALALLAGDAQAETQPRILRAELAEPTDRYAHAVLGDALEWGALTLVLSGDPETSITFRLPETRVFEDVTARLADVTGDGPPEVVVVEADLALGASLAVYGPAGKLAATPFIGQANRWLAPAGIADFDADGRVEIAYVDRPHLLGELVFVHKDGTRLVETARIAGLTNHRIGEDFISGGLRDCGQGPELILASMDWTRIMGVSNGQAKDLGPIPPEGLTIPPC